MGLFRYRALQGSSHSNEGHSPFQRRRESLTGSIRRFWPELKELLWLNWSQRHRRTPEVRQLETTECAAICLAIVLRYYERNEPLSALRRACGVSRNGSNAAQLVRAAGKYQLVAKGMKRGLNSLQEVPLPAVLFWEFNHFVVLEAITTQGIWVNNPATGRLRLTREEFDRAYTGIVISLIPSADFQSGGQRRAPFAELAQQLSRGQPRLSVGLIITQVVSIALAVLLISGERAATHTGLILGLVFSISLMPALITALTRSISGRSGASIQSKLLKMPEWALHQHSLQELSSRHQGLQRISDVIRGGPALADLNCVVIAALEWPAADRATMARASGAGGNLRRAGSFDAGPHASAPPAQPDFAPEAPGSNKAGTVLGRSSDDEILSA